MVAWHLAQLRIFLKLNYTVDRLCAARIFDKELLVSKLSARQIALVSGHYQNLRKTFHNCALIFENAQRVCEYWSSNSTSCLFNDDIVTSAPTQ